MLSRWKDQKIDALAVVVSASAFLNVVSCLRTGFGLAAFYSGAGISRARGYGVLECSCGIMRPGTGDTSREGSVGSSGARALEDGGCFQRQGQKQCRTIKKRQICYSKKRQFCNWASAPLKVNGLQRLMNWTEESSDPPPFAPPEARQNLFAARERERMRSACEHERMCSARASLRLGRSISYFSRYSHTVVFGFP
jgi:hypothetical protein